MKITKLGHACLLVEMPGPVNRTVLFDPGKWSEVNVDSLMYLDDIIITHGHGDHFNMDTVKKLCAKFPDVRITAEPSLIEDIEREGLKTVESVEGVEIFDAVHESTEPLAPTPGLIGVHYLDKLTFPGDCIHFETTKPILALPLTAPWGATKDAAKLAIQLKPKYVLPVHDALWKDDIRDYMYGLVSKALEKEGVEFIKLENGKPVVLEV